MYLVTGASQEKRDPMASRGIVTDSVMCTAVEKIQTEVDQQCCIKRDPNTENKHERLISVFDNIQPHNLGQFVIDRSPWCR